MKETPGWVARSSVCRFPGRRCSPERRGGQRGCGKRHTFCAPVAMYAEEQDDLGAEMAEVARQAEELSRACQLSFGAGLRSI